jgi:hypothetical protein
MPAFASLTRAFGQFRGLFNDIGAAASAAGRDLLTSTRVAKSSTIADMEPFLARAVGTPTRANILGAARGMGRTIWGNPATRTMAVGAGAGAGIGGLYGLSSDRHPYLKGYVGSNLGALGGLTAGAAFAGRGGMAAAARLGFGARHVGAAAETIGQMGFDFAAAARAGRVGIPPIQPFQMGFTFGQYGMHVPGAPRTAPGLWGSTVNRLGNIVGRMRGL